jgi:hypothetical protein
MFVVVAVYAQELPVAAVRGVVVVIVILVMNGELSQPFALEFTAASATNGWKQFQGLFPVPLHPEFPFTAQSCHKFVHGVAPSQTTLLQTFAEITSSCEGPKPDLRPDILRISKRQSLRRQVTLKSKKEPSKLSSSTVFRDVFA